MEQLQKQYQELTFTDDFMFGKVLVNNPEICRRLLEVLLEIKKIAFPERQKTIEILSDGKGIRLDVYVDDENGTIYNIEMQTKVKKELPKRSRYYQGMIDMNLIERGAKYKELKLSFVIFICLNDPFGYGLPEDLAALLQYLKGKIVENELVRMIDNEVEKVKKREEWEVEYMTSYLRDMDIREEGIEIGLTQGLEQGLEQGLAALVSTIKGFIRDSEAIYQAVIKNEAYKDTPREEVFKYLK